MWLQVDKLMPSLERLTDILSLAYTHYYARLRGVKIGRGCRIKRGARLSRGGGGTISLGDRVHVHAGAMILSCGGDIKIGNRCRINPYTILYGHGGLSIGSAVSIAAHTVIVPAIHCLEVEKDGRSIFEQGESRAGIVIKDDVWIGAGARILDGSVINQGCVIAAGAVVKGELTSYGIFGGIPARLLRMRR